MKLRSDDFNQESRLPDRQAYSKDNQNPHLEWDEIPDGTKEFAIIGDDPDAPNGTWTHWVIYGIPADTKSIRRGLPKSPVINDLGGAKQGKNDFGKIGYDGPHPPAGHNHRYFFKLYALKEPLDIGPGKTADEVTEAMKGKVLEEEDMFGTFSR